MMLPEPMGPAIIAAYKALKVTGTLPGVTLHRYQCRQRGCTLVVVFRLPAGVVAYTPPYRLSPGLTQRDTSESGRAKNSVDGANHWPAHGYDLADLAAWDGAAGIPIQCAHKRENLDPRDMLAAVANVTPGKPTRPTVL
jgi:hypothetical protein